MWKYLTLAAVVCAALLTVGLTSPARAGEDAEVEDIPVVGTDGKTHTLRENIGRCWTVVVWYPKASTGGCTQECNTLRDEYSSVSAYKVVLFGASTDKPEANRAFAEHNQYNFVLLSDPTTRLARSMGVNGWFGFANRWTFFIDDKGRIRRIDKSIHTGTAGADLVRQLRDLGVPLRTPQSPSPSPAP